MGLLNEMLMKKNNAGSEIRTSKESLYSLISRNSTDSTISQNKNIVIIENWMKIKSEEFKNIKKFPLIDVDGIKYEIRTDGIGFRVNEGFDEKKKDDNSPKSAFDFYFKLVNNLIYYTVYKNDINVVGSIQVNYVKETTLLLPGLKDDDLCFTVTDNQFTEWTLCGESGDIRKKWICKININLGRIKNESECMEKQIDNNKNTNTTISNDETIFQPIIVIPIPSNYCNSQFNYSSKGKNWECQCAEGLQQSPIDIPPKSEVINSSKSPSFTFENVAAKSQITTIDGELKSEKYIKIKYFKNALRILHTNFGSVRTLDGSFYVGEEIVFHTPSEHKIDGKAFDMEMQVIFYGRTKGDIAKQVVLSFLFKKKAGVYNKFFDDIEYFSLPNGDNPEKDLVNNIYIPNIFQNSDNQPDEHIGLKPFSFYTYQGSLTMPPCSEGTIHYVVADPIPLASVVIHLFQEALRINDIQTDNSENNREIQPLNGRPVFFFDKKRYGGIEEPKKIVKSNGHFEKLKRKVIDYIYVSGKDPSGLPGSYVFPDKNSK